MSRTLLAALLLAAGLALLSTPAPAEAAKVHRFSAEREQRGVATFRLAGVDADAVKRAKLRGRNGSRRVSTARVRRAVRRGVIRVRTRHPARLRPAARAAARPTQKRPKRSKLVVVEEEPAPTEPAPTEPGPTEPAPTEPAPTEPAPTEPAPTEPAPEEGTSEPVQRVTEWRAVGSAPLSDAEAAARVSRASELRSGNALANAYWPSDQELAAFHAARYEAGPNEGALGDSVIPPQRYVTGRFSGTTDEILQWSAHKWGVPEDILRAAAHQESTWHQGAMGDRRTVADASLYPPQARISSTEVYESMGIMQIKWRADGSMHPGTEPLRWKSTAFNADFYGAVLRFYYDGTARSWFSSTSAYGPGQGWESVGAWYQPTPWLNSGQLAYMDKVKAKVDQRTWEQPGF